MSKLEGDHLDGFTYETIYDGQGNSETRIGGEVAAGGLPRGVQIAHDQAENTPTEEDGEGYHDRRSGEDGDAVNAEMAALVESGLIDEKDAAEIRTNPRRYNREFDALLERMQAQQSDPRHNTLGKLREQLRDEDEQTGGRRTQRREELVLRIASLHGGGR